MEKTTRQYLKLTGTVIVAMVIGQVQTLQAGYTGVINGAGDGWASVNVRSVTSNTNRVISPSTNSPSVTMSRYPGYTWTTNNPAGASSSTYSRLKGLEGGIWQATTFAAAGDGTDDPELEARLIIKPANCASLNMDTEIDLAAFNANGHSANIKVNATGTQGTALWLRGFEYTGDQPLPLDDPDTVPNETIEFLKIHGTWKFEVLMEGPFDFNSTNGCPLLIPFTLSTTNLKHLIFAANGVAKTIPFTITCPSDVTFNCGEPVKFPAAEVNGGCGQIAGTWSPEENYAFPVGVTPVTVTVTDDGTNTASCTFNVIIADTQAPVAPALPDVVVGQCSGTPPTPTATDNCKGPVLGKTTTVFPITTQGTNVVTWTFEDGNGHVTTTNQNVIVKDTTPPVKPTLPAITSTTCGSPVTPPTPTTTDNCKGTVTGTTTTAFPITAIGTTVVTWTFNDGNGNVTTANQNVTVSGLTFIGFGNPINGTGGSCTNPVVTRTISSSLPIKFDIKCGNTKITGGTPPIVHIRAYDTNCVADNGELVVANAEYQNDWHYNWNVTGRIGGTYKITVELPDGTSPSPFVFVKLR